MATLIQFPTALARASRDPAVYALRERLQPLADLAEQLGTLAPEEAAGLHALALAAASGDPDRIDADVLRDHLAADIGAATWKAWLRAYGRLQALP